MNLIIFNLPQSFFSATLGFLGVDLMMPRSLSKPLRMRKYQKKLIRVIMLHRVIVTHQEIFLKVPTLSHMYPPKIKSL